jgi:hypothetical protein
MGAHDARQHDILACRGVNAGGEQLRGREDCGRLGVHVQESIKVTSPDRAFVGRYAADIIGILGDEVGVPV